MEAVDQGGPPLDGAVMLTDVLEDKGVGSALQQLGKPNRWELRI